jgi:glyoxylase-like metal-dependent hydrolase (beta-lactamase superfamily II)
MEEVKILIKGFAKEITNGWVASSTTTLIKLNDRSIIVDPGCNRKKLIDALTENKLKTTDIDYVLLTHNHTDHNLLAGIFENAKVVTNSEVYDDDYQVDYEGNIPELDIEILKTPGHSTDSISFKIKVDEKIYVIAGDVFWWMDNEEQKNDYESLISHEDPYVKEKSILEASRKKVLAIADFVIPGHGKMFKVEK